jgi:peroxiredoxin
MNKSILSLTALLASTLFVLAEAEVGKPAPTFTSKDTNGKSHSFAEFKGKIVVLEAYNLDCPFCANHFKTGAMQELQGYATSKGAIWLVVNSVHAKHPSYRTPEAAKKEFVAQKMKATGWIDDSDGNIGKAYGLKTTPHMIVIDQNGLVAYKGAIDNKPSDEGDPRTARNYVREALDSLMAGKAVAVTKTQPYGCGVKYAD